MTFGTQLKESIEENQEIGKALWSFARHGGTEGMEVLLVKILSLTWLLFCKNLKPICAEVQDSRLLSCGQIKLLNVATSYRKLL